MPHSGDPSGLLAINPTATALTCLQPPGSMPSRWNVKSGQSQTGPCLGRGDVVLVPSGLRSRQPQARPNGSQGMRRSV